MLGVAVAKKLWRSFNRGRLSLRSATFDDLDAPILALVSADGAAKQPDVRVAQDIATRSRGLRMPGAEALALAIADSVCACGSHKPAPWRQRVESVTAHAYLIGLKRRKTATTARDGTESVSCLVSTAWRLTEERSVCLAFALDARRAAISFAVFNKEHHASSSKTCSGRASTFPLLPIASVRDFHSRCVRHRRRGCPAAR